jgi:hypothetical protein
MSLAWSRAFQSGPGDRRRSAPGKNCAGSKWRGIVPAKLKKSGRHGALFSLLHFLPATQRCRCVSVSADFLVLSKTLGLKKTQRVSGRLVSSSSTISREALMHAGEVPAENQRRCSANVDHPNDPSLHQLVLLLGPEPSAYVPLL